MSKFHGSEWLEREDVGDVTVVRLKIPPALPEGGIRALFDPISSLIGDMGRTKLVLNLAGVDYFPSPALGKVIMLNRKAGAVNGRLVLCRLTPTVAEVLAITHLDEVFAVYRTEEEALQSFS